MKKTEKLSAAVIKNALAEEYKNTKIMVFDTLDSTNLEAKRQSGLPCPFIVLAGAQTSGRGRLGRSFYSPADTGLYMSVVQQIPDSVRDPVTLTCAAAAAVSRAIEKLMRINTSIKWVNDVYVDGKKVCGILTEGVFDPATGRLSRMITGIGVNISTGNFPDGIEAASIGEVSRNALAAETANCFFDISSGREEWLSYYRERSFITGKRIKYTKDGKTFYGTALGIDDNGALVTEDDEGNVTALFTGEVTVRLNEQ